MLDDLIRPLCFLTVRHESRLPLSVNWLLPALVTLAALAALALLGDAVNVYAKDGLLDRALAFTQTLTGFYIAALAAVSSFNSPHLDKVMPAPAPVMLIKYNGTLQPVQATRRRFLTAMFAYLTALSFLFTLVAIAALVLAPALRLAWPPAVPYLHWLGLCSILFTLCQLTCITFWGLFYLGERMLTPD